MFRPQPPNRDVYDLYPEPDAAIQPPLSVQTQVLRYTGDKHAWAQDDIAVEEPLQIRLAGEDVAVTMRTPGHDAELAAGFLFTEGIIKGRHHIEAITLCPAQDGYLAQNVINVLPTDRDLLEPGKWGRNFVSSSSCGICGKTSIEDITLKLRSQRLPLTYGKGTRAESASPTTPLYIPHSTFYSLEARLRAAQESFTRTGGLHAAALFTLTGDLIVLREDVGRHNAVDKVIGHALLGQLLPLDRNILVVSSRASFEIVQKALMAGVEVLAVFSAPSSLAVDLARKAGMTLVAFLREGRLNVYAGEERIEGWDQA